MSRHWWVLIICMLAIPVWARPGMVRTTGGLAYEGDIVEQPDTVVVTVRGIQTRLPREQVLSVTYAGAPGQDLRAQWKKLQPKDVPGRMALARAAFDARDYLLAREILRDVLNIDPNNREANDFYEMIRGQMELERRKAEAATRPLTTQPGTAPTTRERAFARNYVSLADINNIREMELTQRDVNVRIRFDNDVLRRFALADNRDYTQFRLLPAIQQFLAIRATGAPGMLRDVHVLSDPISILEYRRVIQPIVLAGCATSGCHGTPGKGDFMLYNAPEEPAAYTNFYILSTYGKVVRGGPGHLAAGASRAMIDRSLPTMSLLMQYSLPPAISEFDHPAVRNAEYRGVFHSRNDLHYQQIGAWISNSLLQVAPVYDVSYRPLSMREETSAPPPGSVAPPTVLTTQEAEEMSRQPHGQPQVTNPKAENGPPR